MITKNNGVFSFAALVTAGEDASLPLSSGGSYQILVNNVFYFTQRVVDKLWQGMFNKDSKLVVDFIVQLIGQVIIKELPPDKVERLTPTFIRTCNILQLVCFVIGFLL